MIQSPLQKLAAYDSERVGYEETETECETCGFHVSERCIRCGEVFDGVWDAEKQATHDPTHPGGYPVMDIGGWLHVLVGSPETWVRFCQGDGKKFCCARNGCHPLCNCTLPPAEPGMLQGEGR